MANLVPFDPFSGLRDWEKQMFGDEWDSWFKPSKSMSLATTDVYTKDDKELVVEAHLPDFDEKDVDISVDNGVLEIRAEKHEKEEDKKKKYVLRESASSFYRRLRLPERAETDNVEAHMDEGVLRVSVPLKSLPEPKKVHVKAQASSTSKKKNRKFRKKA